MNQVPKSITTCNGLLRRPLGSDCGFIAEISSRSEVDRFIGHLSAEERAESVLLVLEIQGEPVGVFGLARSDALGGKDFELFCALHQSYEGCGFATEACRALINWALQEGALARVLACVHDSNQRSRRLVDRLGMTQIGRRYLSPEDVYATAI